GNRSPPSLGHVQVPETTNGREAPSTKEKSLLEDDGQPYKQPQNRPELASICLLKARSEPNARLFGSSGCSANNWEPNPLPAFLFVHLPVLSAPRPFPSSKSNTIASSDGLESAAHLPRHSPTAIRTSTPVGTRQNSFHTPIA